MHIVRVPYEPSKLVLHYHKVPSTSAAQGIRGALLGRNCRFHFVALVYEDKTGQQIVMRGSCVVRSRPSCTTGMRAAKLCRVHLGLRLIPVQGSKLEVSVDRCLRPQRRHRWLGFRPARHRHSRHIETTVPRRSVL